ncbi:hypothetical protein [Xanthocytophaga flava]|uniref:hypothetical protein n=1 Tax=Xanthocytophaga flava TaxID=3048013 RepID=UPI0028D168A5|nr:hypothetical protein [Xanthocytophaga flavus]MDJ1470186.1 hypothetical protein [Xanthocytophaga flavus]
MLLDTKNHSTKLFIKELLTKIERIELGQTDPECMLEIIENAQTVIHSHGHGLIKDKFLSDLSQVKEKMSYYRNNTSDELLDITNRVYVILESSMSRFIID